MSTSSVAPFSADRVRALLSPERLSPYLRQSGGDPARALDLYEWSGRMAATAFETVAHLEVILRNALDNALSEHYREAACGIPWFLLETPMRNETEAAIETVRGRLRPLGHDTRHQIVANMSFGFWSGMLGPRYEELWRAAIRHAFPNSSGARKHVSTPVSAIRKFRNRLAHHDSMLNVDIPFEMRRIYTVAEFIDRDAAEWLRHVDRSAEVYGQRPHSPVDTVVVPARDAWPFYEKHFAYVCQPGRWFQPVDRIAFYSDREIKSEVPRIVARRDNVPWTAHEEARLLASSDREDRKIGAIIAAGRAAGWTGGSYQVFILTRAGDPAHRSLDAAVHHTGQGRGSAFVRRQRYASLHALETAKSTDELIGGPA